MKSSPGNRLSTPVGMGFAAFGAGPSGKWRKALTFAKSVAAVQVRLKQSALFATGDEKRKGADKYLSTLRSGVKHADTILRMMGTGSGAKRAAQEAAKHIASGDVVLEVSVAEADKLELWQQGDADLATEEKMRERQALRYDRRVLEVLQAIWEAAQRSMQSGGDGSASTLSKEGHCLMLKRVYRVMIGKYDEAEAERAIAEDWMRDAKGSDSLSRRRFQDAFFELADTWTRGISSYECTRTPGRHV